MFPLRDSTPSNSFPIMTVMLIVVNVFIFIYEVSLGPDGMEYLFYMFGIVPANYSGAALAPIGYIPFVTSMFLHGGWMHLIGNMWILWLFGDNVEDRMGHVKFLIFYLICGILAGLSHFYINAYSDIPVVGASGAVAGVMGAYFLVFRHAKVLTFIPPFFLLNLPAWIYLGFWAGSQLWSGAVDTFAGNSGEQIAFWAHVGGFAAGMLLVFIFMTPSQEYSELE
ncbi:MAG: rhomboid family intramembrane serine protease [Syntrophomonadaceae bacterium]|nr:rhomboid family intramembrane serine protease [Syntrophomonadaceae bacterium]